MDYLAVIDVEMSVSFTECVVIPLETYKKQCTIANDDTSNKGVLFDKIPSDLKMKLFNQERKIGLNNMNEKEKYDMDWIVSQFSLTEQAVVRRILNEYVMKNRYVIDYRPGSLQMVIDGQLVPQSNFVTSLKWLLRATEPPLPSPPPGALQLKQKLISLGVPDGWLRTDPPLRLQRVEPEFFTHKIPEHTFEMPSSSTLPKASQIDPHKTDSTPSSSLESDTEQSLVRDPSLAISTPAVGRRQSQRKRLESRRYPDTLWDTDGWKQVSKRKTKKKLGKPTAQWAY